MGRTALTGSVTAWLLLWAGAVPLWAQAPTVAQMLSFKPSQDVQITTPGPDEYASCEVKLVKGTTPGSSGWLLLDAKKQPLRRFFDSTGKPDSNGKTKIDLWSYYKDGVEVYREIDSNFNRRPDQYRWLNTAGMKWGISTKEDGHIDVWRMISAEEVGHEIFLALAARDFRRLEALFITDAEMRALKLPAGEVQRITKLQKEASAKFKATLAKLPNLDDKARFLRVEAIGPACVPAESFSGEQDVIKFPSRAILFETGDAKKKDDWVQSGEMIQVGLAWRLVEAPSPQDAAAPDAPVVSDKVRPLLEKLSQIDEEGKKVDLVDKAGTQKYNLQRADVIESILPLDDAKNAENWHKQIFDNLSAAGQTGHAGALERLKKWRADIETKMPGSNLAAYAAFRELWATYTPKIVETVNAKELAKLQEEWHEKLARFAQTYPKADDTPDALHQLAMGCEFNGKDEEAKRWYQQIHTNFADHHLADKAKGAERRLNLVGKQLELVGPQLAGGALFDLKQVKDKVVAVYYWASNVQVCERDFEALRKLQKEYGAKGFELVCVSLDDRPEDATKFLQRVNVQATQLFQPAKDGGGANSPLAVQYGINGLPTLFLVGRDGRVINRSLQVGELEAELKKAL